MGGPLEPNPPGSLSVFAQVVSATPTLSVTFSQAHTHSLSLSATPTLSVSLCQPHSLSLSRSLSWQVLGGSAGAALGILVCLVALRAGTLLR